MPMTITLATTINAPRDVVFSAFADFPKSARVLHSATNTEFLSPHTTGLGAEWIQFSEDHSGPEAPRHKITAFEPPRSYVMTSDDPASLETMTFRFTDHGAETLVEFEVQFRPKSVFKGLFARLFSGVIRKFMREDLDRMKNAIEDGSLSGSPDETRSSW